MIHGKYVHVVSINGFFLIKFFIDIGDCLIDSTWLTSINTITPIVTMSL